MEFVYRKGFIYFKHNKTCSSPITDSYNREHNITDTDIPIASVPSYSGPEIINSVLSLYYDITVSKKDGNTFLIDITKKDKCKICVEDKPTPLCGCCKLVDEPHKQYTVISTNGGDKNKNKIKNKNKNKKTMRKKGNKGKKGNKKTIRKP